MQFGWHGISFAHDDDFGPAVLTGTQSKGYVRLQSGEGRVLQVRWLPAKTPPTTTSLSDYFKRLQRDNRKSPSFNIECTETESGIEYRYSAALRAEGLGLFDDVTQRVFFVEALNTHRTGAAKDLRRIRASFEVSNDPQTWAVMGLHSRLPGPLRVIKTRLLSGRIGLDLSRRGLRITIERWALAKQLLERHDFGEWLIAASKVRGQIDEPKLGRMRIRCSSWSGNSTVIAKVDPVHNQIVFARADYRDPKWEPTWEWLDDGTR